MAEIQIVRGRINEFVPARRSATNDRTSRPEAEILHVGSPHRLPILEWSHHESPRPKATVDKILEFHTPLRHLRRQPCDLELLGIIQFPGVFREVTGFSKPLAKGLLETASAFVDVGRKDLPCVSKRTQFLSVTAGLTHRAKVLFKMPHIVSSVLRPYFSNVNMHNASIDSEYLSQSRHDVQVVVVYCRISWSRQRTRIRADQFWSNVRGDGSFAW